MATLWLGSVTAITNTADAATSEPPAGTLIPDAIVDALVAGDAAMIMRHSLAPGTGDPDNFTPGDCATQRNLSTEGREQARATGQQLRAAGITAARVRHSEWCRCRDTATLLGYPDVDALPILNSFFQGRGDRADQTDALHRYLAEALSPTSGSQSTQAPLLLVTHQVNITALTGVYPASGELLVVTDGEDGIDVVFRLAAP